jgi:hypothetical protein
MGTLTQRLERAVNDKGLSIGDAWNLLSEALEYITAQQRTIDLQANEVRSLKYVARRYGWLRVNRFYEELGRGNPRYMIGDDMDAAIDAALSAQPLPPPHTGRGEPMACPCGKCPDGYFGER